MGAHHRRYGGRTAYRNQVNKLGVYSHHTTQRLCLRRPAQQTVQGQGQDTPRGGCHDSRRGVLGPIQGCRTHQGRVVDGRLHPTYGAVKELQVDSLRCEGVFGKLCGNEQRQEQEQV